jgi:hypothetical protein
MRDLIAIAACSIALNLVSPVSGFAQSDSLVRLQSDAPAHASSVMTVYGQSSVSDAPVELPPNLSFPEMYRETVEAMLQRSPAFRRQCMRLANAPELTVHVRHVMGNEFRFSRARTKITRLPAARLHAEVEIPAADDFAELMGHELEHIIEQLDGVDLILQASLPGTGVRTCDDGSFETIRARRIGALVAYETRSRR